MRLDEAIHILPPTPKREKIYPRKYYEATIGEASGKGQTADEAVNNLKSTIQQAFHASYETYVINFRNVLAIGWRNLYGWSYQMIDVPDMGTNLHKLWGVCSGYETAKEMISHMRSHLAQNCWDGEEEASPIIEDAKDQHEFGRWTRWQKRYRELKETGMDDTAIRWQLMQERL